MCAANPANTVARICLFYRLAQANTTETYKNDWTARLVRIVGYLNAPTLFIKLERRLRMMAKLNANKDTNSFASFQSRDSINSSKEEECENATSMTLVKERGFWALKIVAWFIFWCLLSLLVIYPINGDILFEPM
jgi:hypothetical protein